jgi:putative transposase
VPKGQQSMVAAALRQAFIQPDRPTAAQTLRHVADQLRAKWPKLGAFIDESETDVLAHMDFPAQHRTKIHSTNPLERLNKEVKRRADVVGIFPNEQSIAPPTTWQLSAGTYCWNAIIYARGTERGFGAA